MQPRQLLTSEQLATVLIDDDGLFESLNELEKQEIIEFCTNNLDDFSQNVDELLYIYGLIIGKAKLLENEEKIISYSKELTTSFQSMQEKIITSFNAMGKTLNQSHALTLAISNKESYEKALKDTYEDTQQAEESFKSAENDLAITKNLFELNLVSEEYLKKIELIYTEENESYQKKQLVLSQLQEIYNEAEKELESATNDEVGTVNPENSIYTSTQFALSLVYENMQKQMELMCNQSTQFFIEMAQQHDAMLSLVKKMGIEKIQIRLEFCIEILLSIPYTKVQHQDHIDHYYSKIAISLAKFWYDEGIYLSGDISPTEVHHDEQDDNTELHNKKNLTSLMLFYLANPSYTSTTESMCYKQLLLQLMDAPSWFDNFSKDNFSLLTFARESPVKFARFYHYLFHTEHVFSKHIETLENDRHIYVSYRHSLMKFYLAIAYQEIAKTKKDIYYEEKSKDLLNEVKLELLSCFEFGVNEAASFIDKYFCDDLHLKIQLAVGCFNKNELTSNARSQYIYNKIKNYSQADLDKELHSTLFLFKYWMRENNERSRFATDWVVKYTKSHNQTAYSILRTLASTNPHYAVIYGRTIMEMQDKNKITDSLTIFINHPEAKKGEVLYCHYQLIQALTGETDFSLLIEAADDKCQEAIDEINKKKKELPKQFYQALVPFLNKRNSFSSSFFQIQHKDLFEALFNSNDALPGAEDLDLLTRNFYRVLYQETNNELLEQFKARALSGCVFSREMFLFAAQYELSAVEFLLNTWCSKQPLHELYKNKVLISLNETLRLKYSIDAPQVSYYIYLIQRNCFNFFSKKWLGNACCHGYLPAIKEVDYFLNNSEKLRYFMQNNFNNYYFYTILQKLSLTVCPGQYASAEALCVYHLNEKRVEEAEKFYKICQNISPDIDNLIQRLKDENQLDLFLKNCSKATYDQIYRLYTGELPSDTRHDITTSIQFWQNLSTNNNESTRSFNSSRKPK